MSDLVTLHHNEPMTTSLAIAEGVELQHKNVIELIRKYAEDLSEFGGVAFETRPFDTDGGMQWRDVSFLNEQQSTLLITFMRNSPVVIKFKKELVRAFFEMRDHLRAEPARQFVTGNLSHGADLAVAADRTFRSFLRAARSAGLALPQALRTANRQTIERTGMDMLAELGVDPGEAAAVNGGKPVEMPEEDPLLLAIVEWAAGIEAGEFFTMADIMQKVCGIRQEEKAFQRVSVRVGPMLRRCGFKNRKTRYNGRPIMLWTKH